MAFVSNCIVGRLMALSSPPLLICASYNQLVKPFATFFSLFTLLKISCKIKSNLVDDAIALLSANVIWLILLKITLSFSLLFSANLLLAICRLVKVSLFNLCELMYQLSEHNGSQRAEQVNLTVLLGFDCSSSSWKLLIGGKLLLVKTNSGLTVWIWKLIELIYC